MCRYWKISTYWVYALLVIEKIRICCTACRLLEVSINIGWMIIGRLKQTRLLFDLLTGLQRISSILHTLKYLSNLPIPINYSHLLWPNIPSGSAAALLSYSHPVASAIVMGHVTLTIIRTHKRRKDNNLNTSDCGHLQEHVILLQLQCPEQAYPVYLVFIPHTSFALLVITLTRPAHARSKVHTNCMCNNKINK